MLTNNQCSYFNSFIHFLTNEFDEVFNLAWEGKSILMQIPTSADVPTVILVESDRVIQGYGLNGIVIPIRVFDLDNYEESKTKTLEYLISTFHQLVKKSVC